MIIIKIYGGLGNQLFQYALYEKFRSMGRETYADLGCISGLREENVRPDQRMQLENVKNGMKNLGIHVKQAKAADIARLSDIRMNFVSRVRRKICPSGKHVREGRLAGTFQPQILELADAYVEGYWQSERYFMDIRDCILRKIHFEQCMDVQNRKLLETVRSSNSVSIHVRRGDYTSRDLRKLYGGICTAEYYKKAIRLIAERVENPKFIFFSNDMDWVRKKFGMKQAVYADWNHGESDYYDMYLMSQCRHNVVANSSFSWWGAWLNENSNKIVISPARWFRSMEAPDTVCREWIKI